MIADSVHLPSPDITLSPLLHFISPRSFEPAPGPIELVCKLVEPLLQANQRSARRFAEVVLRAAEEVRRSPSEEPSNGSSLCILTPRQLRHAQQYMLQHLSRKLPIAEVAAVCRLSASHFSRSFRGSCGVTPHHWLLQQRIEVAKRLLSESHFTIPEIALECGFTHRVAFSKAFSRIAGVGPSSWRRSLLRHWCNNEQRCRPSLPQSTRSTL